MTSLSTYLQNGLKKGIQEFRLVAHADKPEGVEFYIHPLGKDGITADYLITDGGTLILLKESGGYTNPAEAGATAEGKPVNTAAEKDTTTSKTPTPETSGSQNAEGVAAETSATK